MFDSSHSLDNAMRHADPTLGIQALADAGLDPAEECMRAEEGGEVEVFDRAMVLRRLLVFLHEGTFCPGEWARRFFALAVVAHPVMVAEVSGKGWERGCVELQAEAEAGVLELMRRRVGPGGSVAEAQGLLGHRSRMRDVWPASRPAEWEAVMRRLLQDLREDGLRPSPVAKRLAAYTHVFHHRLLGMASCAEIGALFGGQERATVSARVRRVVNDRVEGAGAKAHAPFQKSASAVEAYRAAAMGNSNRKRKTQDGKTQDTRGRRRP